MKLTIEHGGEHFILSEEQLRRLTEEHSTAVVGAAHHFATTGEAMKEHWVAAVWFTAESVAQWMDGAHALARLLPLAGALMVPVVARHARIHIHRRMKL